MEGWIKLYRKFTAWEWWDYPEMVKMFIYLLLTAKHKEGKWRGRTIKRGQLVHSRRKLAKELKLSEQTVRTCICRLELTHEITIESTHNFTIITLCNYESYQNGESGPQPTNQPTNQPTANPQINPLLTHKSTHQAPLKNKDLGDTANIGHFENQPTNQPHLKKKRNKNKILYTRNGSLRKSERPKISKDAAAAVHEFYIIWNSKTFRAALKEVYENYPKEKKDIAEWLKYKNHWGVNMNSKPDDLKECSAEAFELWQNLVSETDFELLWSDYPRKRGKKEALKHFRASVKNADDLDAIRKALDAYIREIDEQQIKERYIQYGATWFNNWRDWYDKD